MIDLPTTVELHRPGTARRVLELENQVIRLEHALERAAFRPGDLVTTWNSDQPAVIDKVYDVDTPSIKVGSVWYFPHEVKHVPAPAKEQQDDPPPNA